jgi:hypothetical protein
VRSGPHTASNPAASQPPAPPPSLGPFSLMTGKLDWALLKGLRAVAWRMGNLDWAASDHRYLLVEAE